MDARDFELHPIAKQVLLFPLFIGALLPLLIAGVMMFTVPAEGRNDLVRAVTLLLVMPLIGAGMAWNLMHLKVRLSDKGLRIRSLPFPRTLRMDELDLDRAEVVDLNARPELIPAIKLVGTRLPGYRAGRFRLRDKRHAMVILTDLRKVLVLPTRSGKLVLLSLLRPEALLEAMRRNVARG
jgi:hypothetical protein